MVLNFLLKNKLILRSVYTLWMVQSGVSSPFRMGLKDMMNSVNLGYSHLKEKWNSSWETGLYFSNNKESWIFLGGCDTKCRL